MPSPRRLRTGILGLGFGSTLTLPDIARHPGYAIVAAADPRPAARDAFTSAFGGAAVADAQALCAMRDLDLVYICTPAYLHAGQAVMAAEHGRNVLVEKPMALTAADCDRMIAAAERNRVALLYGHTHSYDPPIRAMRALIEGGSLGRLRMLTILTYTDLLYRPRAAWELDTSRGGGVVYIQASHQIDIARLLAGSPAVSLQAGTYAVDPSRPTEGAYGALLTFRDGAVASLTYSGYARFDSAELHFRTGEDGRPRDPDTHAATVAARQGKDEEAAREAKRYGHLAPDGSDPPGHSMFGFVLASLERADVRQSPGGLLIYETGARREQAVPLHPNGRQIMLDEAYAAIVEGRAPLHDGRWGRATVAICEALLGSAGRAIPLAN